MKLVGVDYGRRRIGLSVCDGESLLVRGLETVDLRRAGDPVAALRAVIEREAPSGIVVGLPLDADDGETARSLEIREFAKRLEKSAAVPVYFIDESCTSKRAEELLRFRKKKERRDKAAADRLAACLILESYLREQQCAQR